MPSPVLNRREFLQTGLVAAGAASLTACVPDRVLAPVAGPAIGPLGVRVSGDLAEPAALASVGGRLTARIAASTQPAMVAGRQVLQPVTYNGTFPGPTLLVRPGDLIDLTFTNRIVFDQAGTKPGYGRPPRPTNATNLHYHGMHVSPVGTADNMLIMVPENGRQRYLFEVPADHPAGLYWYHAHVHGLVTSQVGRGAAGMIYVANAYTDWIAQLGFRHRLMTLQQVYLEDDRRTLTFNDGNREDPDLALSVINGQLMPDIRLRPGEPQVWSILNATTSAFYVMRLEGHQFDVIGEDGVPYVAPLSGQETLFFPSGKRFEVVVRATATNGRYALSFDAYNQGVDTWPQKPVGTVVVEGTPWSGPAHPGVDATAPVPDLRGATVDQTRLIVFGQDDTVPEGEFGRFTINGHAWDPNYSEWTSTVGTVEEWHIRNDTGQDHPFHVHVNPFQVTELNGSPVPLTGYQDTATVPRFGSLTVRTRFTDFTGGPILMHCHILDHEDMGMMTRFEIAAGATAAGTSAR